MTKIFLHSLTVVAQFPGAQDQIDRAGSIPAANQVDLANLRTEISGRSDNHLYDAAVWQEAYRRINFKLAHGQSAVLTGGFLQLRDVDQILNIVDKWGTRLYWVFPEQVDTQHRMFPAYNQVLRKIQKLSKGTFVKDAAEYVVPGYQTQPTRMLAVGDVHGNLDAMHKAIQTAKQEDRFLVWLGDVVDYGSENLRCIRTAYETVAAGRAHMIWGNHERKISRWISNNWGQQFRGRLSDANLATIREIEKLPADSLTRFHTAWQALENWSTQHWVTSNWMFTHGAATVNMWNTHNHRLLGMDQEHAYFGEVQDERAKTPEGYPVRTWDWVNSVPNNHTVVVGHDWLDHDTCRVTVKHGTQGGQVICVDTGSGKGGRLGGVAIDIETQKWEERYFDT